MLNAKSNEQAEKFRVIGNEFLKISNFFDALVAFNKSLCFAEPSSVQIALTFEARSHVFFQIGQYGKCLKNIEAAREHGLPGENITVVKEREEKCQGKADPSGEFSEFFNLSYPANSKIPFIVECLELHENEKFGRFVVTTQDLFPGDILAIEEPHFTFMSPKAIFTKCFNCLKSNMLDLVPSSAFVMFCSEKCHRETMKKFSGDDELIRDSISGNDIRQKMLRILSDSLAAAGGFKGLKSIVEFSEGKNLFDFDLSDSDDDELKKKILICIRGFAPKADFGIAEYLKKALGMPEGEKKDFSVDFISRIILCYMRNGVKIPGRSTNLPDGGLLLPFVTMMNHSCDPNVYASFVDNKCVVTVIRSITAGEQIFINYRKTFMEQKQEERHAELLKTYEFSCECVACVNRYPLPNKLRRFDKSFDLPSFGHFGSNKELLAELKENFKYMKENNEKHPSYETSALTIRNKELLKTISERATFPFVGAQ